jgi:integrase
VKARGQVQGGTYTPDSPSATIALWIERGEAEQLEAGTLQQYRQLGAHLRVLLPDDPKLARLTQARVEAFRDAALQAHSRAMARKVLGALKSTLKDAKRRGLVAQNVAAETAIGANGRHRKRLEVRVDVPTPAEVRTMLEAGGPKDRAMVALAALPGLRASELRALRWPDLQLGAEPTVTVSRRADRWAKIGSPKSATSRRTVPAR